jgi:hypothetical protein
VPPCKQGVPIYQLIKDLMSNLCLLTRHIMHLIGVVGGSSSQVKAIVRLLYHQSVASWLRTRLHNKKFPSDKPAFDVLSTTKIVLELLSDLHQRCT